MALFLNNNMQYGSDNKTYSDSIVMCYNKQFFSDYDTAKESLINKNSLPGEITFAYYYDKNSEYGQNAIFSVGPLTQGSNIIFKNANEIDTVVDTLNETLTYINSSVSNIDKRINTSLNNCRDYVDEKIDDFKVDISEIESNLDILNRRCKDDSTNLNLQIRTLRIDMNNKFDDTNKNIKKYIDNTSTAIVNYINNTSDNIVDYINRSISESFDNTVDNTNSSINYTKNELTSSITNFKNELNQKITGLEGTHNSDITRLTNIIDEDVKADLTRLSNRLNNYIISNEANIKSINESISTNVLTLNDKIESVAGRIVDYSPRLSDIEKQISVVNNIPATIESQNKSISNLNDKMKQIEDKYNIHFQANIEQNQKNITLLNENISDIKIDMAEIRTSIRVDQGTIGDNIRTIEQKIDDIIERLTKIDVSINTLENYDKTNDDTHKDLLVELKSYKNSLDY